MDPVSFGFGVLQTFDICLKYGTLVYKKVRAYKESDERFLQLFVRIRHVRYTTEVQILALRDAWQVVPSDYKLHQDELLGLLQGKLETAVKKLDRFVETKNEIDRVGVNFTLRSKKKARFSVFEDALENIVLDLEKWSELVNGSWAHGLTLNSDQSLNERLNNSLHGSENLPVSSIKLIRDAIHGSHDEGGTRGSVVRPLNFLIDDRRPIAGSSCSLGEIRADGISVIVEKTNYPATTDMKRARSHVCDLARILAQCSPSTIGLLRCLGVIRKSDQFELLYALPFGPSTTHPVSLRALLLSSPEPSLNIRIHLANCLVKAVMSVHTASLVHKNIRPETLLLFPETPASPSPLVLGMTNAVDGHSTATDPPQTQSGRIHAFLVGFERFRPADANTVLAGDMVWERNLYRHPKRQGIHPEEVYKMQHDVYSLGVAMLEIGLWKSFVRTKDSYDPDVDSDHATVEEKSPFSPDPILQIETQLDQEQNKNQMRAALQIKARLLEMVETLLPSRMGDTYTDVVKSCLSCLDKDDKIFKDEDDLEDEEDNGITVGIKYIENVMVRVEELRV